MTRNFDPVPFFSVIIPTKNRAAYLGQAIQSVLAQTYRDFELIVVDNCSEDNTPEILSALNDPRLVVFHQEQPVSGLRNFAAGLSRSSGEYVAFLSDDDWWHEDFLLVAAQILQAKPHIDLLFFDHWVVDAEGQVLVKETQATSERFGRSTLPYGVVEDFLYVTIVKQPVNANSAVYKRVTIQSLSGWSDGTWGDWADYPLNIELALQGCVAFYVPLRLGYYRRHKGAFTSKVGDRAMEQQYLTWEAYVCEQLLAHPLPDHVRRFVEEKKWTCLRHLAQSYLLTGDIEKACELFEILKQADVGGIRVVALTATLLKRFEGRPRLFQGLHKLVTTAAKGLSWWLTWRMDAESK